MNAVRPPEGGHLIFVVADDPDQRASLVALLRSAGGEVRCFESAEEALSALRTGGPPRLLVSDLCLPGIDGLRFCRLLRSPEVAPWPTLPVVLVASTPVDGEAHRVAAALRVSLFAGSPLEGGNFLAHVGDILCGRPERDPLRVLVVEDDTDLAGRILETMVKAGYEPERACTADEGADALRRLPFDLVLLNARLDTGPGGSLLHALQAGRPACVCVVMTEDAGAEETLDWMRRGAAATLPRPFDQARLLEVCAQACREQALLRRERLVQGGTRQARESEMQFRNLVESTEDWVWAIDTRGVHTYSSGGVTHLLGYAPGEIVGRSAFPMMHPEDAVAWRERLAACVGAGKGWRKETLRWIDRRGRVHHFESSASPVFGPGGRVLGFQGIDRDVTDRVEAEEALRARDRRHRTILETAVEGFWIADLQGRILEVNDAYCRMSGYSEEELLRMRIQDLEAMESREETAAHMKRILTHGVDRFESSHRRKDGSVFPVEVSVQYRPMEGERVVAFLRDMTATRRAQEDYQTLFREMLNGFALHEILCDAQGRPADYRFLAVNPAFERMTGLKAADILGKTVLQVLPRTERAWIEIYGKVALNGEPVSFVSYSGAIEKHFEVTAFRPAPNQFACIFTDVTKLKEAEEGVRRAEESYRNLFLNSQVGLYRTDFYTGLLLEANDTLARFAGYENREEMLADAINVVDRYVDPEDRVRMLSLLKSQGEFRNFETRVRKNDGSVIWMRFSARVQEEKGLIEGVAEEITYIKKMDEERARLEAQFHQAQKMESVGRLAGGVAHDFNNMLGVILGQTEMALLDVPIDHPLHRRLLQVQQTARRSAALVRQLLAFARKQTIAPVVLDLNDTVTGTLKMLRRLIGEDIALAWVPGAALWPIEMDPSQIDQILANLCVNARDAITGVGTITLRTGNARVDEAFCGEDPACFAGDFVLLSVEDSGCGMDRETLDRLFEPFFTTKEVGKGTGLGLATVYGIVKQNNGFVRVESVPGAGSVFRIYLPRYRGDPLRADPTEMEGQTMGGRETVLFVEDEPMLLDMGVSMLEKLGYRVFGADGPMAGQRLVEGEPGPIHLLMTDVVMPDMNGRDLADRLQVLKPGLRCLFMSGYTADVIAGQGVLDKGLHFLQKPFSLKDLAAKVREVLDA